MKTKAYNIVYRTTNLINGKIYVGVHCTDDLNDGYIGCGVSSHSKAVSQNKKTKSAFIKAVLKYGYDNFKREDLYNFGSSELAFWWESYIVDEDFINRSDVYNNRIGGRGGSVFQPHETRVKIAETLRGRHPTAEARSNQSLAQIGRRSAMKGRFGKDNPTSKKVECIQTGKIYHSIAEAKRETGIKTAIVSHIHGKYKYAGRLPDGTQLTWRYV